MACYSTITVLIKTLADVEAAAKKLGWTSKYQGKTQLIVTHADKRQTVTFNQYRPDSPVSADVTAGYERELARQLTVQYGENKLRAFAQKNGFTVQKTDKQKLTLTRYR